MTKCDNKGVSAFNLIEASKKLGFDAKGYKCELENLKGIIFPAILNVTINDVYKHYIVLLKIDTKYVYVFDPASGKKKYSMSEFNKIWNNIVITLVPNRILDRNKVVHIAPFKDIVYKNRFYYLILIFISFVSIFLALVSNYYFKALLDNKNILVILVLFSLIIALKELTNYVRNKIIIKLEYNIDKYITINTHEKLLSLPYYYFNSRKTGDIISKIDDLDYVKELFLKVPLFLFVDIILLISSTIILIKVNINLFLIFSLICFLYILVILIFNNKTKNMIRVNQENKALEKEVLVEDIKAINTIKNLDIRSYRCNLFNNRYDEYLNSKKNYENIYSIEDLIKNIILFVGINIMLYIGMKYVNTSVLKLSDLILFNSLILYFIEPLISLCELNPLYKNSINALNRISEIYKIKIPTLKCKNIKKFDIKIKNLSFSYDGYNKVFNNVNLSINDKDKLIVIGNSGIGKSTLFRLINKTYDVDDNMIFINGKDINKFNITPYISYISQDELLFSETLYNNLVLGESLPINKLDNICHITSLDKIMKNKNINYDSIIEENGINFSKGERQIIMLTRVLLKNNNIIILDEALNGVDEMDEYNILRGIIKEYKDKTIIYITHRNTCVKLFKNILDIKKLKEEK